MSPSAHRLVRVAVATAAAALLTVVVVPQAQAATGSSFRVTPRGLDFGAVQVGAPSAPQHVVVTNTGAASAAPDTGGFTATAPWSVADGCAGRVLTPGESCALAVTLAPVTSGAVAATLSGTVGGTAYDVVVRGAGVAPAFRVTPTVLDFGELDAGATARPQRVTVTNVGQAAAVPDVTGLAGDGAFAMTTDCGGALAPGESCALSYTFTPPSPGFWSTTATGSVGGVARAVALRGVGAAPAVHVSPRALDFGEVRAGETAAAQDVVVTNVSATTVSPALTGFGAAAPFAVTNECTSPLAPGESCRLSYRFTAGQGGVATATSAGTVAGRAYAVTLRGTALGAAFRVTPTGLDFGDVVVGATSAPQDVVVTNVGVAAGPVLASGFAGSGPFTAAHDCAGRTLAPGESCRVTYRYAPSATGTHTASSTGSVAGATRAVALRGTGFTATPQVSLQVTPTGLDFGDVRVGTTSASQQVVVTNTGTSGRTLSVAGFTVSAPWSVTHNCAGRTLLVGESCQFVFGVAPTAPGTLTAAVSGSISGRSYLFSLRAVALASAFRVTPTALDFGTVAPGAESADQTVVVMNTGSLAAAPALTGLGVGEGWAVSHDCAGRTLAPGESCQLSYRFAPVAVGVHSARVNGSIAGVSRAITLTGTSPAPALLVTPQALDFGDVPVGASAPSQDLTVTNVGPGSAVAAVSGFAVAAPFAVADGCAGRALGPGESCQLSVSFAPATAGAVATVADGSVGATWLEVDLRGRGVGSRLRVTPFDLDFGPVDVGTAAAPQRVVVTNTGVVAEPPDLAGFTAAAPFLTVASDCAVLLAPGASCAVEFTFEPTATGDALATVDGTVGGTAYAVTLRGRAAGDLTPPEVDVVVDPASPAGGWHRGDVAVTFTVRDPESPVSATEGCGPHTVTADTGADGVTLTCTATSGGGTTSRSVVVRRDATAPSVTATVTPAPAATGWYNAHTGAPTVRFACADPEPGSGLRTCGPDAVLGSAAGAQAVEGMAADLAGNTSTAGAQARVDLVPPTVACPPAPAYLLHDRATLVAAVTDGHSGAVAAEVSAVADTSAVGRGTVQLTGADHAGNATAVSCGYTVGVEFGGFDQPAGRESFRAGSVVPVRFALLDAAGARVTDELGLRLAAGCGVVVALAGTETRACAAYDADADRFTAQLRLARELASGSYELTATATANGAVVASGATPVEVRGRA